MYDEASETQRRFFCFIVRKNETKEPSLRLTCVSKKRQARFADLLQRVINNFLQVVLPIVILAAAAPGYHYPCDEIREQSETVEED